MVTRAMGKGKKPPPAEPVGDESGKKGTLKVNGSTHQLLHKIAAHRGARRVPRLPRLLCPLP